jgi:hypothetical protein
MRIEISLGFSAIREKQWRAYDEFNNQQKPAEG